MVEGSGLLSRPPRKGSIGSNPILSATINSFMLRIIVLLLAIFVAGCATNFCAEKQTTNCRPWSPGDKEGPARG